ncbi:MAG: RraA family protein [Betaproteobacteria bacterium]|nr:RraA family protein [Betaproteobacteria bacterium]
MTHELDALRQRFLAVDTTTVSDVLEQVGCRDQALATDLVPLSPGQPKLAGFAYTVRGQRMPYDGPGDPDKMQAIEGMSPGVVSVWAGDAEGMACFGELLALGMKVRGCTGIVVSGGVRDAAWIVKHGIPVYTRYRSPVQSITRWKVTGAQVPVVMPGATARTVPVNPGDFLLGDLDGVVVVPAQHLEFVLAEAERITERESRIRGEIDDGASLDVVLGRYGRA